MSKESRPRFSSAWTRWVVGSLSVLMLSAADCKGGVSVDTGAKLTAEIAAIRKEVKGISDVGVISELGWVSKMMRDYAVGSEKEREAAQAAARRLFGTQSANILESGGALQVTVRMTGFSLTPEQTLSYDLKYIDFPNRRALPTRVHVDSLFNRPAGNGWAPPPVRSPDEYARVIETAEARVRQLAEKLVAPTVCGPGQFGSGCNAPGTLQFTAEMAQEDLESLKGVPIGQRGARRAELHRRRQVDQLVELIAAPYRISALPPAGEWTGEAHIQWGTTHGTGRSLVLAIPQSQLRLHPKFEAYAWLHPTKDPKVMLGVTTPIKATDLYRRCVANPQDPSFAAVSSNSSDGPLCWFIFDLFPSGMP
jgi:hypothetical protein